MSSNTCQLREKEGGEATNILEHHINTGNSPPIPVPPYRTSPVKNCPDCIKYKASNQKPSGLLQTPVPAQSNGQSWPLISLGPYQRVKMIKDGSSSLRIVPPSGSNCLHYPMPQLKNVPLH
ncbi:hypothetical protein TNCV_4691201 [Trichonephila clavipes]|nr:hypothetical protein TNCV_4691201 [Trichonephila clavipes]